MKPKSGFQVIIKDADGVALTESETLTLTMTSVFNHSSTGESAVKLHGDTAPGRLGSYIFQFKTTLPIPRGGSMVISLPSEL